ncbi:MAG: TolC family protein [Pirellulales bacterium]|nr:TolC family protein [Pirellulales bacterium]
MTRITEIVRLIILWVLVLVMVPSGTAQILSSQTQSPALQPVPLAEESPVRLPAVTIPDPWERIGPSGLIMPGNPPSNANWHAGPITLADIQQIAQQNNPTLIQARMAVQAARGQQIQAGLYPNPELGYTGADVGLEGTSGQQGGMIAQEFVTAGKLWLAQSAAGHGVAAAIYDLEAQRLRVTNAVRAGFYEVLLAQKMVDINQDLVRISGEAEETTSRLRAAGEVSKAELLQANIESERARVGLFMARNRHRIAWYQLAAVLGLADMPPAPLVGDLVKDLPTVSWDDGLTRLLTGSPELARAKAAVEQARCHVALQCAERRSNFTMEAGVKYDESAEQTLVDVGVSVPLRIFDRNQGNVITAQAQLVAATREVERVELDLFHRFAESFESYSNANRQVELYRSKVLASAKESLELVKAGYHEGEFDYLSLLTAQRTYFAANLEYLAALRELWQRSVELDGLMLTGGLQGSE